MEESPILSVKDVCKSFAGLDHQALEPVQACVERGQIVGLVGPDGAGKTTLLRLAAGLLKPDGGSVRILGRDPLRDADEVRQLTGYMPQKFGLYEDLTVRENLDLYADLRGLAGRERTERFEQLLSFSDLEAFTARRAGALSGGMKQKLGLACALLSRPRLLLLDEPSVGVDPLSRRELWRMVHELVREGMGVVWSTAYLDEAELCHQVVLLREGKMLYRGPPGELAGKVRGRCFRISGITTGRRRFLTELLDREEVVDGVIEAADLRIVLADKGQKAMLESEASGRSGTVNEVKPRFEDAFVDLLGGAPPGTSALARKIEEKRYEKDSPVVEARELTKRFGDFTATREISFGVKAGEIFGLLGPNGAGKSTTFKMMCGLLKASSGEALVSGTSLSQAPGEARQKVGYMAQKFSLYGMLNPRQNLEFFSGVYGLRGKSRRKRVADMIELFGLEGYLRQSSGKLPLGIKQRLALACAVMHRPDILFLDEPTSGVDPLTRREFWSHINGLVRKGVTVMVTTHFMDEAEYCDRIGLIYQGEMIAIDTPQGLKDSVASEDLEKPTLENAFIELIKRRRERKEAA